MRSIVSSFIVVAALGMTHAALAQQTASEADYCRTLARAYLSQNPVQGSPNVADATLADGCSSNAQGTIGVLKQKLASHGIDLPKPATAGAGE
jgi:hypothetical protein